MRNPTGYTVTFCTSKGVYAYASHLRLMATALADCTAQHVKAQPNAAIVQATIAPEDSQQDGAAYWDLRAVLSQGS